MAGQLSDEIGEAFNESVRYMQRIADDKVLHAQMARVVEQCVTAFRSDKKLLVAGNGGSAADAQHWVAELVSRFAYNRAALRAVALTTDTSILTAIGNDYGFEQVFSRQIEALGSPGDVAFLISTSGRSLNIVEAARAARSRKVFVVGFTGQKGGALAGLCDIALCMPHDETAKIQEGHEIVGHLICGAIERAMFPPNK